MGFDYRAYVELFQREPGNRARGYGVEVVPAMAGPAQQRVVARCLGVWHLLPEENGGKHNVYIEVIDEHGLRVNGARLLILRHDGTIRGRVVIDKPDNEPGTNTHIHSNETLGLLAEGVPSDRVVGLHTRHADEAGGNQWGHHSYLVVFRIGSSPLPPPEGGGDTPSPQPSPPGEGVPEEWLREIDRWVAQSKRLATEWEELRERWR